VPRAAFAWVTKKLMGKTSIPIITSNRINTPEVAEDLLSSGCADMVSLARPFLADPNFVAKAAAGKAAEIAPCIACNQACLDHTFSGKISSCLVNPRACFEKELAIKPALQPKKLAIVGAGPAGLSCAMTAAQCGHHVTVFDKSDRIGGQLNLAKQVPGKEEFWGLVDWFQTMMTLLKVDMRLGHEARVDDFDGFDEVIIATGVSPRDPAIPGQTGRNVHSYIDVLSGKAKIGDKAIVIGAGGIGFDVSEYLLHAPGDSLTERLPDWMREWGVGDPEETRGGLAADGPQPGAPARAVTLVQRKAEKHGKRLGKTTGWIHRSALHMKGVEMIGGVNYEEITEQGLRVSFGAARETPRMIEADDIILCAGQEPERSLADTLLQQGRAAHVIGGADVAAELDAKRAIDQGVRLALSL
jgi:2,4-dienoyl-CoA reductase (NADPH2)